MSPISMGRVFGAWFWVLVLLLGPAATFAQTEGKKYALLVGVEAYDPNFFNRLNFAEEDVIALGREFKKLGYEVVVMTTQAAFPAQKPTTAAKILTQLEGCCKRLGPNDTLIVALSGHGVQFAKQPRLADGSQESYFCPEEADLNDLSSLVPLSRIVKSLADCPAQRKLLIVDACRNEAESKLFKSSKVKDLGAVGLVPRTIPKGMLALYSCTDGEKSVEDPALNHGVFTYHLLKYLRGEGQHYPRNELSLTELANFARRETSDYVFKKLSHYQTPLLASAGGVADWPLGPFSPRGFLIRGQEAADRRAAARRILLEVEDKTKETRNELTTELLGWGFARLGDIDRALGYARKTEDPIVAARILGTAQLQDRTRDLRAEVIACINRQPDEKVDPRIDVDKEAWNAFAQPRQFGPVTSKELLLAELSAASKIGRYKLFRTLITYAESISIQVSVETLRQRIAETPKDAKEPFTDITEHERLVYRTSDELLLAAFSNDKPRVRQLILSGKARSCSAPYWVVPFAARRDAEILRELVPQSEHPVATRWLASETLINQGEPSLAFEFISSGINQKVGYPKQLDGGLECSGGMRCSSSFSLLSEVCIFFSCDTSPHWRTLGRLGKEQYVADEISRLRKSFTKPDEFDSQQVWAIYCDGLLEDLAD